MIFCETFSENSKYFTKFRDYFLSKNMGLKIFKARVVEYLFKYRMMHKIFLKTLFLSYVFIFQELHLKKIVLNSLKLKKKRIKY